MGYKIILNDSFKIHNRWIVLHLISLNKYVVDLIINQGNSCLTYFMIVSKFITLLASIRIIPLLEKILLLVRYSLNPSPSGASVIQMQFVFISSIMLAGVIDSTFKGFTTTHWLGYDTMSSNYYIRSVNLRFNVHGKY